MMLLYNQRIRLLFLHERDITNGNLTIRLSLFVGMSVWLKALG